MLARGALCRLAGRTTPHDLPQLARTLPRSLFARNASTLSALRVLSRAYASALQSRRAYATTTRATEPTATVKKAVKAKAAKKPAPKAKAVAKATPAKSKSKTAAQKTTAKKAAAKKPAAKTAAKKKAAPRKKVKTTRAVKERTPDELDRIARTNLRKKALKEPGSMRKLSAYNVFVAERTTKGKTEGSQQDAIKLSSQQFKALSPAEQEHYNHLANEQSAARVAAYKAWIHSHTPAEIRTANNARATLRRLNKTPSTARQIFKYTSKLVDDRAVKKAPTSYMQFLSDRFSTGDFKGIPITESSKLIAAEWKALSAGEKKKYEDMYQVDKKSRDAEFARMES